MECMRIQPVTSHPGENALFIVLGLAQGDSVVEKVKDFAGKFSALTRSLSNRYPETKFNAILGFSSNAWGFFISTASKASRIRNISRNQRPKIHSRFYTRGFILSYSC